jgi:hypothetical protein
MAGPDDGGWRRPAGVTHNGRGPLRVTNGQKRGRKTHVDARGRQLWLGKNLLADGAVRWFDTRPVWPARPGYANNMDDSADSHYTEECQQT